MRNRIGWQGRFVVLLIGLSVMAGCTDYHSFEWGRGVGWETARSRSAQDVRALARSLEANGVDHAPGAGPSTGRHLVMPGDTASSIAADNGMSLGRLAEINGLRPPYNIYVGQVLRLEPYDAVPRTHTVGRGETLLGIASRHGLRLDQVRALNPSIEPDRIRVGQKIVLRGSASDRRKVVAARRDQVKTAALAPVPTLSDEGFTWPVDGVVVGHFGSRANGTRNDGIDIRAAHGSTVRAAEAGVVVYSGEDIPSMGRMLMIRHDDGYLTAYAHNRSLLVRAGDPVRRAQPIAKLGATGDTREPLLHFELRKGKTPVDPLAKLPKQGVRLAHAKD